VPVDQRNEVLNLQIAATTNTNTNSIMAKNRTGGSGRRAKPPSARKQINFHFAAGERSIPAPARVGIVKTSDDDPTAMIRLPVPAQKDDPHGVRILGWVISASAVDSEVRFVLGQSMGKNATVKVPVDQRNEVLNLQIVASTDGTYAIMFRMTAYYTVDTIMVAGQHGIASVDLELPDVPSGVPRAAATRASVGSSAGRK